MSPSGEELLRAAMQLSEDDRIVLAGRLLESVAPPIDDARWTETWRREVARRWEEMESGQVQGIPWSDVDRELDEKIQAARNG